MQKPIDLKGLPLAYRWLVMQGFKGFHPWELVECHGDNILRSEYAKETGKDFYPIAQRRDNDTVAGFEVVNNMFTDKFISVHLTYSGKREADGGPTTNVYNTLFDWISEEVFPDTQGWMTEREYETIVNYPEIIAYPKKGTLEKACRETLIRLMETHTIFRFYSSGNEAILMDTECKQGKSLATAHGNWPNEQIELAYTPPGFSRQKESEICPEGIYHAWIEYGHQNSQEIEKYRHWRFACEKLSVLIDVNNGAIWDARAEQFIPMVEKKGLLQKLFGRKKEYKPKIDIDVSTLSSPKAYELIADKRDEILTQEFKTLVRDTVTKYNLLGLNLFEFIRCRIIVDNEDKAGMTIVEAHKIWKSAALAETLTPDGFPRCELDHICPPDTFRFYIYFIREESQMLSRSCYWGFRGDIFSVLFNRKTLSIIDLRWEWSG